MPGDTSDVRAAVSPHRRRPIFFTVTDATALIDVVVRLDPRDGNDPIEAEAAFREVPREGEQIEVWVKYEEVGRRHLSGPHFLEVETVVWCSYWPERIEVWVRADSLDRAEVEAIMVSLHKKVTP